MAFFIRRQLQTIAEVFEISHVAGCKNFCSAFDSNSKVVGTSDDEIVYDEVETACACGMRCGKENTVRFYNFYIRLTLFNQLYVTF